MSNNKKHNFKVYWISFAISVVCIAFPWIMAAVGVLADMDVLETYSFISAAVAFAIICLYVCRKVSELSTRLFIIFLNPVVLYAIIITVIAMDIANSDLSNGFRGLVP